MPSTHKKVIIRKTNRDWLNGYVAPDFIVDGSVEVLTTSGNVVRVGLADIRGVFFVRDFNDSEALTRKTFTTRPRSEGLWVRLRFRDNEILEGMMANDLSQLSAAGLFINPPDTRANTQRIFVPHTAVSEVKVLAVIGSRPRKRKGAPADERQQEMFEQEHSA